MNRRSKRLRDLENCKGDAEKPTKQLKAVNDVQLDKPATSASKVDVDDEQQGKAEVDLECVTKLASAHVFQSGKDVYDVMLNQTNIQNNNNKFFLLQLLENNKDKKYSVWFRWGRVGFKGQSSLTECGGDLDKAIRLFSQKFRDKTRNEFSERSNFVKSPGKYDLIKLDYGTKKSVKTNKSTTEEESTAIVEVIPDSKLDPRVRNVMELICDLREMEREIRKMEYDTNKCPLGSISKVQVKAGFEALSKIEKCILSNEFGASFLESMNEYYTRIPHCFGMRAPPKILTIHQLKNEITLLETLSEIEIAVSALSEAVTKRLDEEKKIHPLDRQYSRLRWVLEPLHRDSQTFKVICKYLNSSHGSTHSSYKMHAKNIFELKYVDESMDQMNRDYRLKVGNRRLLWHGSRMSNWYGILSQGLRIAPPEAPITGYMFGKGVYFADSSSKSANYTLPEPNKPGFMVLSEVALGVPNQLYQSNDKAHRLPEGKHSVHGIGRYYPDPKGNAVLDEDVIIPCGQLIEMGKAEQSKLQLLYNEFIVYDTRQVRERFLVEVEFKFDFDF